MSDTATPFPDTPALEAAMRARPSHAATIAARIIGVLTLGWGYLACTDLRWLLHLHALHFKITRAPLAFRYGPYLALNIANVAAAIIAAAVLIVFPSWLLGSMTPEAGSKRKLSTAWVTIGTTIGLILLVLGIHAILATALWTIYQSGHDVGWQMELCVYALAAAAGVLLCRTVLAEGREV
jgi:hypothetical protein